MSFDFSTSIDRAQTKGEKYTLREMLFKTENVIPMWVADMDIKTPPCVLDAVQKRALEPIYGYEEVNDSVFEAQISWMKKRHNVALKREWMLYSHSVVASISVAIQTVTKPGEKVIVQGPIYPPFFKQVSLNGREVLHNPLKKDDEGRYTFDIDDLRSKIDSSTKLLLLCSPHNPVGRVWSKKELQALTSLCLEHDITIFSDEIHSDLIYSGHQHYPLINLGDDVKAKTITAIGPGKSFNLAGLAISTVAIADEGLRERYKATYDAIHFAQGNVFGSVGFEAVYKEGELWLDALLKHLYSNVLKLEKMLLSHSHLIHFQRPEGTYLAWLDCSQMGLSNRGLRDFFVDKAALGLSPGISFSKEGSQYMRLNFAVPTDIMDEAIAQLDLALSSFEEY